LAVAASITLPGGQAPHQEGDRETAAHCSKRRRHEIGNRRVPTRKEALEVFQDASVNAKAADDPHAPPARAIACHRNRADPA
jgi:hypothetical protein